MTTINLKDYYSTYPDLKVFHNHIYEYKKGIRRLVLFTVNKQLLSFAMTKLDREGIEYFVQEIDGKKVNLFFGRPECLGAIRKIVVRPLNELTPEEDFILGALLGYDLTMQCERYLSMSYKNMDIANG